MKHVIGASVLALFLICLPPDAGLAAEDVALPGNTAAAQGRTGQPTPAMTLAAQVSEIANSRMISHAKKEKRISTAVRIAVVAATAYKNPAESLNAALDLATVAASAAPQFKDVITDAVSFIPSIARIDGAPGQIRAAVYYAAANAGTPAKGAIARNTVQPESATKAATTANAGSASGTILTTTTAESDNPSALAQPEKAAPSETMGKATVAAGADISTKPEPVEATAQAGPAETAPKPDRPSWWTIPEIPIGDNASLHLTANAGVHYDDNIYLTKSGKVSDEIASFGPGAEFRFGQNSLAHGSLIYQEDFTRYLSTNVANAQLGTGNADFGYDNGTLTAGGSGSFQQLDQNNRDVVLAGRKAIIRSDVLDLNANVEEHVAAKTSLKLAGDYSHTDYRTTGLANNSSFNWPVKLYYAATPKVDLSAGVAYRDVKVEGAAQDGRDLYYNLGARGEFTPKLSGEFSAGYKTRSFGQSRNDSTFGFDGTFTYELTPKTSSSLVMSRDFSTGAQGESLKNTSFSLSLSAALSLQWQANASLSYQNVDYSTFRKDNYWEGGLSATYMYSSRLSATAGYTLRNNSSTLSGAEFSDNIFSLTINFRS
ncbi:MAG TPA: outer membrane beta-barrel protein [Opitutaceae bacterium]|jgi:hypothetical protein|nr:outer membrane beta-barrel protein [Opitutaceae bacterium]